MKKKALIALTCAALAGTVLLTSCSSAAYLQFSPNWELNYQNNELSNPIHEEFVYEIKYNASSGLNSSTYQVAYCKDVNNQDDFGSYKVTLDGSVNGTYTLVQECAVPVVYTFGGESVAVENTLYSVVEFGMTNTGLRPISSYKELVSYSPTNGTPNSLDTCYRKFDYAVNIVYNDAATASESISVIDNEGTFLGFKTTQEPYTGDWFGTNLPKYANVDSEGSFLGFKTEAGDAYTDDWFGIDYSKHSYLDNEQLYFAFRGLSDSAMQSTNYVNSYDESSNCVRTLVLSASAQGNTTDYQNVTVNGTAIGETPVAYNAVSLAIDSANSGASQELWYAANTATIHDESARNVLLKIKTNIHYSLGSLEYNLKSISWND